MKYRKKPLLSARDIQLLILVSLIAIAVLGTLIGADIQLSRGLPGGGSFFATWEGARAFLFEHTAPYSSTVASLAQEMVYGRLAQAGENPYFLAVPFFLMPLYFPLALIPDAATARGVWLFINQAALVGTAFLSLRLIEWQPRRMFHIAFALLSVFSFYSIVSLLEGGPAILLGFLYAAILLAYYVEQDELAGALLVLTLFAWEIGLLYVILLIWWTFHQKRWRVLAGFGMALALLMVVSLIIYPGWMFPYLISTLAMLQTSFGATSIAILQRLSPAYGVRAAQAMTVLLVILLLYEWSATRRADFRRFVWTACFTLAATPLIGLRTDLSNMAALFPALALIFAATTGRWRTGYWLTSLLLLLVLLLPWGWFVRWYWLHDGRAYDYLLLFYPLFTMAGLYWTRWWFLRPPRTWFDDMRTTLDPSRPLTSPRRLPTVTGPAAQ
ncbi:MAG: hypothetical protein ACXVJU_17560 [Candidatus Angelobacter sp.]